jgi:predicted nucleotidyltransferase
MSSDNASAEREAASLAEVLGRLADVTAEGTCARASLVRYLERVLAMFEARMGETHEALVLILGQRLQTLGVEVTAAVLFGSAGRGELEPDSDIDLLLVAEGLSQLEAQAHFKATRIAASGERHRLLA